MNESTTSKKVITFIFLKFIEIGGIIGIIFAPYFLGKYLKRYEVTTLTQNNWGNGFLNILSIILLIILVSMVIYLIYFLIKEFVIFNWRWACILNETEREKKIRINKREKRLSDKKKKIAKEERKEYGYYIGDKVKVIRAELEEEKKLVGKTYIVGGVTWADNIRLRGYEGMSLYRSQVKPVRKTKRNGSEK